MTIEISYKAERNSGHYGLRSKALQILSRPLDHYRISGKDISHQISSEKCKDADKDTDHAADPYAGKQSFPGPLLFSRPYILGDKGRHSLHQGAGQQHNKADNLISHSISGRCFQSKTVDKCAEGQERKLCQDLLKSNGSPPP